MKYTENYMFKSYDCEPRGTARPAAVLRLMQETANHNMQTAKPSYYELYEKGMAFVISRLHLKFNKPITRFDEYICSTWACPSKGVTFQRNYTVEKDGEIFAFANSAWALVDFNSGALQKVNDFDRSGYCSDDAIEPLNATRFKIPSECDLHCVGSKKVYYSDIDLNLHMNNTRYPELLCDHMPNIDKIFITEMYISFVGEAAFGEQIEIYRSEAIDNTCYFKSLVGSKTNIEAKIVFEPFDTVR